MGVFKNKPVLKIALHLGLVLVRLFEGFEINRVSQVFHLSEDIGYCS